MRSTFTSKSPSQSTPQGTHFRVFGSGSQSLVFAHGVGLNKDIWQPQVKAFVGDYQVVCYDLLGHGDSPTPDVNATMDDYVEQLEELRETLAIDKIAVIGHSTGALISLGYGLAYPQNVTRLVTLNAIYCRPKKAQAAALNRVSEAKKHGPLKQLDNTLIRWFGDAPLSAEHKVKRQTLRNTLEQANISGYGITYRLFVESDRLYEGRLDQINCPTLFLTGELDPNSTPSMSIKMANEVSGASGAIVPNSRHMTPYVDDKATNAIVKDFLLSS